MKSAIMHAAIKSLIEEQRVVREGLGLRMREHRARLSEADQTFLEKISDVLHTAGLRPPIVGDLANMLEIEQAALISFLERVANLGHLVRVAKNRFFLPETMAELVRIATRLGIESVDGTFDAASFRDRSGIGRNLTIEVLEFLDRSGVTRFAGGKRSLALPNVLGART